MMSSDALHYQRAAELRLGRAIRRLRPDLGADDAEFVVQQARPALYAALAAGDGALPALATAVTAALCELDELSGATAAEAEL